MDNWINETLTIEGMTCGHCIEAVRKSLSLIPGVEVNHIEIGKADVRYDQSRTSRQQLEHAVMEEGYRVVT